MDNLFYPVDKSVDKFFSSNILESSSLVIDDDEVDNLFYPFGYKNIFQRTDPTYKKLFISFG